MKPRTSAPAKTCDVKAHKRTLAPSALYNSTSAALFAYVKAKGHKFRVKAGRKVQ